MSHFLKDYLQQELKQVQWLVAKEFEMDYNAASNSIILNDKVFDHLGPDKVKLPPGYVRGV
jgi:hypothetical protein